MKIMNKLIPALAMGLTAIAVSPTQNLNKKEAVVGVYDSRAIAIAYIRSEEVSTYLGSQMSEFNQIRKRAIEMGDVEFLADLDALGPAMQQRIHEQGFGTASIDNIIKRIEDRLPAIAKDAGVEIIVSKWELDYKSTSANAVDITEKLAAEFSPSKETLKSMREVMKQNPVPLAELKHDD